MKKLLSVLTVLLIAAMGCAGLSGCLSKSELARLDKALTNAQKTFSSMDNIDNEDLSAGVYSGVQSVQLMSAESYTDPIYTLSVGENLQKVNQALELQAQLRDKQASVDQNRLLIEAAIADFKVNVKNFTAAELQLTQEEKDMVKGYISELAQIREALIATIGQVYRKIADLRGQYRLSNLDNIIAVYTNVQPHMDVRVEKSGRIVEILGEINIFLAGKIADEY